MSGTRTKTNVYFVITFLNTILFTVFLKKKNKDGKRKVIFLNTMKAYEVEEEEEKEEECSRTVHNNQNKIKLVKTIIKCHNMI